MNSDELWEDSTAEIEDDLENVEAEIEIEEKKPKKEKKPAYTRQINKLKKLIDSDKPDWENVYKTEKAALSLFPQTGLTMVRYSERGFLVISILDLETDKVVVGPKVLESSDLAKMLPDMILEALEK